MGYGTTYAQVEMKYGTASSTTIPYWARLMYQPKPDPAKVIAEYTAYYKTHPFVKNQHTQYYKRWQRGFSRSLYPYAANSAELVKRQQNQSDYLNQMQVKGGVVWQGIGPFDFDKDAESRSYAPGAAHVYAVEQSPSNPNILYAGTSNAGVWRSIDKGQTWYCLTKGMLLNYVFSVEIHPTNPDIALFFSEGKVYKTTDGGSNWTSVALSGVTDVRDIVMDPVNPNIVLLSSDGGYYRSTNGGAAFTQILSGDFQEIELHPTNHNMVYLIEQTGNKTVFRKSTDNGQTFSSTAPTGWPVPANNDEQKRTEIATTPAAPNSVYALCTGAANGGSGLYGIYVSTDMGATWQFRCCGVGPGGVPASDNINMMGWDKDGLDDGGQYYYDLALEVSDTDALRIHVGGVNHWVSADGGYTFTCPAKWSEPELSAYVHADIHDIRTYGNDLWIACDGGIFYSNDGGENITRRMKGIEGTDFWGFGATAGTGKIMLGGTYHNGTLLKDDDAYEEGWLSTMGGDNVRGYVNFANDRLVYHDYGKSILSGNRTVALNTSSFPTQPNASYIIGESSNYEFHPHSQNIIYFGNENRLVKTDGNGGNLSVIFDFGEKVTSVEIAPTNPDVIYVCTYPGWWDTKHVWRSTNGGQSWTNITPASGQINGADWVPYDIAVSATDANTVWLSRNSQYGDYPSELEGYRVFKSTNGGTTWVNYTGPSALNGESVTHIEHQAGTDGGVYVGTRRAVYYRNNTMADWQLYNSGLPASTFSVQLALNYRQGVMWNATNRSVYEAPLFEQSTVIAQIAADKFTVNCLDNTVHFADNSVISAQGASWQWSFPGGSPATSTQQNPVVTYNSPGVYNVSLIVTDANGTASQTLNGFITYTNTAIQPNVVQDFEQANIQLANWTFSNSNQTFDWDIDSVPQGPNCTPTHVLRAQHYYINNPDDEAYLISPKVSLANMVNPVLSYYYAFAEYPGYTDGFRVEVSNDCGQTWNTLFFAEGDALTTTTPTSDLYIPTDCNQWVQKTHALTSYIGDTVLFRFAAINDYGNNFYLDNINITATPNAVNESEVAQTRIFPNPGTGEFFLYTNAPMAQLTVFSADGRQVYSDKVTTGTNRFNLSVAAGMYIARVDNGDKVSHIRFVVR